MADPRTVPFRLLPFLCALGLAAVLASPAQAITIPDVLEPVRGNPAERLVSLPIEAFAYDRATRCRPKPQPGTLAFQRWLDRNADGVSWGIYRCEKWGRDSASLHAEHRAVDWHLDAAVPAQRREAERLIVLLLAPDRAGNPAALARRMGVQEIIFDCRTWFSGGQGLGRYSPCYGRRGKPRKRVDRTLAHRDHIHFGLTKAGARGRTSFWRHAAGH